MTSNLPACLFVTENIALHKHATQSSNYGQSYGPNLAVDGDATLQGRCAWAFANNTGVVAGERGQPAWWSVDLASQDPSQRFIVTDVTVCFEDARGRCESSEYPGGC